MPNTYTIRCDNEYPTFTLETITQNMPYTEQVALFGIMNNTGSSSLLRIKNIIVNDISTRAGAVLNSLRMIRATAMGTGTSTVTPNKFDSNASNLPSPVRIELYPASYTGTEIIRDQAAAYANAPTTALACHGAITGAASFDSMGFGYIYRSSFSECQPLTLRENEGMVLAPSNTTTADIGTMVELTVDLSDGTNTYHICETIEVGILPCYFGIFNESGSGVVLNIGRISIRLINTLDGTRLFNLETISAMCDGRDITPIKMDSTQPDIPQAVWMRENPAVTQANVDARQFTRHKASGGDQTPLIRYLAAPFGTAVGLANGLLALHSQGTSIKNSCSYDEGSDLILREGQGIAIMQRGTASCRGRYRISLRVNYESTGSGGGSSEHSFVWID
jgi:hypothetical protein